MGKIVFAASQFAWCLALNETIPSVTKSTCINVDNDTTRDVLKINYSVCILFQGILHVIIKKMKYDESYNFEHEVFICHLVGVRFILPAGVYLKLNICRILIMTLIFITHKFFLYLYSRN